MAKAQDIIRSALRYLGLAGLIGLITLAVLENQSGLPEGSVAPTIVGQRLDGQSFRLTSFEGKPAVLNFWATWCTPCLAELPDLEKAFQTYGDRVAFVGVTLDSGTPSQVAEVVQRFGLSYPVVVARPEVQRAYQVRGFPTTLILAPDGTVAHSHSGSVDFELLTRDLAPLL